MAHKNTPETRLKEVWQAYPPKLDGKEFPPISRKQAYQMFGNIFCPGPFYYFVFNFSKQEFGFVNPLIKDVLGFSPEEVDIKYFTSRIKEEDISHLAACEKKAGTFYFHYLSTEQINHYKTSYCFRVRKKDGSFVQILHQSMVINQDDDDTILNTLVVHSVIDHLTTSHNRNISFMSLSGDKHYMGLNPYTQEIETEGSKSPLTRRETQVLGLLAEGCTNEQVAEKLFISAETVAQHRKNIRIKLSCNNSAQAVAMGIRGGWI